MNKLWLRWRWGVLAAVCWAALASFPQVYLWDAQGRVWHGTYASAALDEVAYMSYVRALSEGRPRRNDPHTGRDDQTAGPQAESLFSLQFIPPYLIAGPARVFNVSTETAFVALSLVVAALSALAIFGLARLVTGDERLAFAAPFFALGLGTLAAGQGLGRHLLTLPYLIPYSLANAFNPPSCYYLPFLRLYQPGLMFPLFFVLCALFWRALTSDDSVSARRYALGCGAALAALVFGYFFLWTAAAAWLACVVAVWYVARPAARGRVWQASGIVAACAAAALAPYFWLLSHRAATTDGVQALRLTRQPELWRAPEIIAAAVLLALAWGARRGRVEWRSNEVLFTISLALLPFVVFNQQVVTGRMLQPVHYEWYVANYAAVLAATLAGWLLWRRRDYKNLLAAALLAFAWGGGEAWLAGSSWLPYNQRMDEARPVLRRLAEDENAHNVAPGEVNPRPLALTPDLLLADRAPAQIPQAMLWTPHLLVFPGATVAESQERFWLQLYLSGVDRNKFLNALERKDWTFYAGMFDYEKLSPAVGVAGVRREEINAKLKEYLDYAATFTRAQAAKYPVSYVVVRADNQPDFNNLDRWYARDAGEQVGLYVLYRVKLKP
jgi:hypothetical protein